uniref:Peptidase C1A papain C-terminal domain-containing protein n=1 Tax=Oryza meridionalis TaxID=40149 RepID=A0A0E0DJL6_9ORYZ
MVMPLPLRARSLPPAVDWCASGAMTMPQRPKHRTCWAFAVVSAIEELHKIKKGSLVELSKQQALEWVHRNDGVTSEVDYPYTGDTGTCNKEKLKSYATTIICYSRTLIFSELALMEAVARQPVAVSMSVSAQPFMAYQAGTIFDDPCSDTTSHAMLVVGYGATTNRSKYWIIKNSYGPRWGDNDYLLVMRGVNSNAGGLCGIAASALFPMM